MNTEKLNFNFPVVKNMEETKNRHQQKTKKLKSQIKSKNLNFKIFYDYVLNEDYTNTALCHIHPRFYDYLNTFYRDYGAKQMLVRIIKTSVNYAMQIQIKNCLEHYNLYKSNPYVTAFYIIYQDEIDKIMKNLSKNIYDWFVDAIWINKELSNYGTL